MKRRLISLLAAGLMLVAIGIGAIAPPEEAGFADVPADAWYADVVEYCRENGLMSGISDTTFSPDTPTTRAMLVAILYRRAGSPAVGQGTGFTDVPTGAWYADALAWASASGVVGGYSDGRFGPGDQVTREQLAAILWRSAGSPAPTSGAGFADQAAISAYAADAVGWARESGIVSGGSDGRFDPKGSATRAQVAAMLCRWLSAAGTPESPEAPEQGGVLVAYFSATGHTEAVAGSIADTLDATLYEIVPETPYTSADLDYNNAGSRCQAEHRDAGARPAIAGDGLDLGGYDVVFLGYPIWNGQAPKIISTFLESHDFAGKTIVPFCTSGSSGIGSSATALHTLAPGANWRTGSRFSGSASTEEVAGWVNSLGLPKADGSASLARPFNFETKTVTLNSGYEMPINGLGTYSLHGDECVNSVAAALRSGVRLIDTAQAYGNEREVGEAIRGSAVPRDEIFVITKLYPNQYSDPEGAIDEALEKLGIGYIDMMLLHHPGAGDVAAYKAMEKAVAEGKIRSLGLSNWYVEELEEFLPQISVTPALVQNEIHPYYQENDVIPYIQDRGIVVQGWYPLGGRGHTAELLGDKAIAEIAAAHGKSAAQVILRWNLQKGVVVIPGSSNPDHIRENTALYDFALTEDEMARINALDRGEKHDWY